MAQHSSPPSALAKQQKGRKQGGGSEELAKGDRRAFGEGDRRGRGVGVRRGGAGVRLLALALREWFQSGFRNLPKRQSVKAAPWGAVNRCYGDTSCCLPWCWLAPWRGLVCHHMVPQLREQETI